MALAAIQERETLSGLGKTFQAPQPADRRNGKELLENVTAAIEKEAGDKDGVAVCNEPRLTNAVIALDG